MMEACLHDKETIAFGDRGYHKSNRTIEQKALTGPRIPAVKSQESPVLHQIYDNLPEIDGLFIESLNFSFCWRCLMFYSLLPRLFILMTFFGPGVSTAHAASFDCNNARTPMENAICSDTTLSALDDELNKAYKAASEGAVNKNELRQSQREWLKSKEITSCQDAACWQILFAERIEFLNSLDRREKTTSINTAPLSVANTHENNTNSASQVISEQPPTPERSAQLTTNESPPPSSAQKPSPAADEALTNHKSSPAADEALENNKQGKHSTGEKASVNVFVILITLAILSTIAVAVYKIFGIGLSEEEKAAAKQKKEAKKLAAAKEKAETEEKLIQWAEVYSKTVITQFAPFPVCIERHKIKIGDKSENIIETDISYVGLTFSKCKVTGASLWSARHGTVDSRSFSSANIEYEKAHMQWMLAKQQYDLAKSQEANRRYTHSADRQNNPVGAYLSAQVSSGLMHPPFNIPKPKKPSESDYVVYDEDASGDVKTSLDFDWQCFGGCESGLKSLFSFILDMPTMAGTVKVQVGNVGVVEISKSDRSWIYKNYSKYFDRIADRRFSYQENDLTPALQKFALSEQDIIEIVSKEVNKNLLNEAKSKQPKYYKSLELGTTQFGIDEKREATVILAVVASKLANGKLLYTLHDPLIPHMAM